MQYQSPTFLVPPAVAEPRGARWAAAIAAPIFTVLRWTWNLVRRAVTAVAATPATQPRRTMTWDNGSLP